MALPETIARIVSRHSRALHGLALLIAVASAVTVWLAVRFDSQVVNLLPGKFDSVKALKLYDETFEQARELTFVIEDESGSADLEGFADHFVAAVRQEPWFLRVMDRSPIESPGGMADLQKLAVPLLLNLPSEDFRNAIELLEPATIETQIKRLHRDLAAGSPKAQMQLEFDPLGPVTAALAPMAGTFTLENTEPLASPDGTLRIVSVVTRQQDLSTHASRTLMDSVEAFMERVIQEWDSPTPKLMVTGRAAYVAEMSGGMKRDITMTLLTSVALVSLVFYIGFRRVRPLFGIIHTLVLSCLAAIAVGGVFLRELNLITIGFCSILIGLGVDFGMLLFGNYQTERDHGASHAQAIAVSIRRLGGAVGFGALTTAAAFLCLLRSDSAGFAQLGVLIAIGISFAAVFMVTLFFAFAGAAHRPREKDFILGLTRVAVDAIQKRWKTLLGVASVPLLLLSLYGFSPVGTLHFEADPGALEPENSRAGEALRAIRQKIPAAGNEPVLVLLQSESAANAGRDWEKLDAHWRNLKDGAEIAGFTSPAPFVMDSERQRANAESLSPAALAQSRTALENAINDAGFRQNAFAGAFSLIDSLAAAAKGDSRAFEWRNTLDPNSPWWFLLDRYFSDDPRVAAAYVTPVEPINTVEKKERLRNALQTSGIRLYISGWSYTLADLIPWSKGKLIELSVLMVLVNAALLYIHVRRPSYLGILILSLLLATGALIACLKAFNISLHLFNVLAFPLVLGVGVDYGIYVILAVREPGDQRRNLIAILRPVMMSGLTTLCGFGSLGLALHPALSGLGIVCALGIAWCLLITFIFTLPACLWIRSR